MKIFLPYIILILAFALTLFGCREVALYGRLENVPRGEWNAGQQLSFSLEIPDTTKEYYLYASIRHTAMYPYRNIWIRMGLQQPESDSISYQDFDLPLASNESWLGTGMNDVYDRRVRLFGTPVRFSRAGKAGFTLQHIMRNNPLPGVLQVGIRIEPVP